jgi:hypothetical protein
MMKDWALSAEYGGRRISLAVWQHVRGKRLFAFGHRKPDKLNPFQRILTFVMLNWRVNVIISD